VAFGFPDKPFVIGEGGDDPEQDLTEGHPQQERHDHGDDANDDSASSGCGSEGLAARAVLTFL
jgi:hypothetical protein